MNPTIGFRLAGSFLILTLLVVLAGGVGLYDVSRLASMLRYVSGPAWQAADGAMEGTINLKSEMLILGQVISAEISHSEGKQRIEQASQETDIAIARMGDSGLLTQDLNKKTERLLADFRSSQNKLIDADIEIQNSTKQLLTSIDALIELLDQIEDKASQSDLIGHRFLAALSSIRKMVIMNERLTRPQVALADVTKRSDELLSLRISNQNNLALLVRVLADIKLTSESDQLPLAISKTVPLTASYISNIQKYHQLKQANQLRKEQLLTHVSEVEEYGDSQVESKTSQVDALISSAQQLIYLVMAAGVLVSLIAWVLAMSAIAKPVREVADRMTRIGEHGDGTLSASLDEKGSPELKQLAKGFNHFVKQISKTISGVQSAVQQLNKAASSLQTLSGSSQKSILQLNKESDQVAAAIGQLTGSANEISARANEAFNAAEVSDQASASGLKEVDKTIHMIKTQMDHLHAAASVIERLAKDSHSIGSVLDVINEIADQTNLLALNAAIEAARAGEAGRGFSVVADEVRQLASRTQQATTEIKTVVSSLQSAAGEAVETMRSSTSLAEESVQQAKQAGSLLHQITAASNTISNMNQQIAAAAGQQASVSQKVEGNVEHIGDLVANTQQSAEQIASAASGLLALSDQLKQLSNQFKN